MELIIIFILVILMMADIISTWQMITLSDKGIEVEENKFGALFLKYGFMAGALFKLIFTSIGIFFVEFVHCLTVVPFLIVHGYTVFKNIKIYKRAKRRAL